MFSNVTVSNAVLSWTCSNLKAKTEYIIEVKAGTVVGFGPPSVVHQKTSGKADVKYVKKSNKAYIALAKAGIAAGVLSFLGVVGFFVFISLLVTGYVPYTSPWRKRRREVWRKKAMRRNEEREIRSSDSEESDFNSSIRNSSERGSSDDDSDGRPSQKRTGKQEGSGRKGRTAKDDSYSESIYNPGHISVSLPNPEQGEIYGQVLLNAYAKSLMDMQSIYGGSTYGTRPVENIYGNRSVVNIPPPGNIYGGNNLLPENIYGNRSVVNIPSPGNIYGGGNNLVPENIYGNLSVGNFVPPEDIYGGNNLVPESIYGNLSMGNFVPPENIYGDLSVGTINRPGDRQNSCAVMPEEIYGPNVNTLSVHNYPSSVTSENLYGTH
ncbi:uncharacterized protein LOC114543665 [Dendronephthya gigantea]|nr:uncharacterized protein LOC114543665 [Dendronephthya gigantea]